MNLSKYIEKPEAMTGRYFIKSVKRDLVGPISTGFLVGILLKLSRAGFKFTQKGEELVTNSITDQ